MLFAQERKRNLRQLKTMQIHPAESSNDLRSVTRRVLSARKDSNTELKDVIFHTCLPIVRQQLWQHEVGLMRLVARVTVQTACPDDGTGPDDLPEPGRQDRQTRDLGE